MRKPKAWGQPCPKPDCTHYRLMNRGNISAISTYMTQSGKRRIFLCHVCDTMFSETRDTVFFDLRTPEDKVMMALKMLLVKVGLTDIGFVLGISEETVLMWLERAAQKAYEINAYLLRELPGTEMQLDMCGASSSASMSSRPKRREKAATWVRTGGSGYGSVLLRSFVSSWRRLSARERLRVPCTLSR
jgi:transposase-like protein